MNNYRYLLFYWSFNSTIFTKNKSNTLIEVKSQNQKYDINLKFDIDQSSIIIESRLSKDIIGHLTNTDIEKIYNQSHVVLFQIDLRKNCQKNSIMELIEVAECVE